MCAKNGSSSVSAKLEVNHGRRVVTLGVLLPRDAMQVRPMPSCGLSVCVCVRLSRSWILSKRVNVSSIFFHRRVATPF